MIFLCNIYQRFLLININSKKRKWESSAFTSWQTKGHPCGITPSHQHLCVCTPRNDEATIYNAKDGQILTEISFSQHPMGIDSDQNNIYVAETTQVTILNLNFEIISSWKLPVEIDWGFRGLKVDNKRIYLTILGSQHIFICDRDDGKVLQIWGNTKKSSKKGEFNDPSGLTVNKNYVYICDCNNHSIQSLTKEIGQFMIQWGDSKESTIVYPRSIYLDDLSEILYIGDNYSVQLFSKDGICLQRLGDRAGKNIDQFDEVSGICIIDELLYVSDYYNSRIQIFKRIE